MTYIPQSKRVPTNLAAAAGEFADYATDHVAFCHTFVAGDTPEQFLGEPGMTAVVEYVTDSTLSLVSDNAGDTGTLLVGLTNLAGQLLLEPVVLTGTTPVNTTISGYLLTAAQMIAPRENTPVGTITLTRNVAPTDQVGSLAPGQTKTFSSFQVAPSAAGAFPLFEPILTYVSATLVDQSGPTGNAIVEIRILSRKPGRPFIRAGAFSVRPERPDGFADLSGGPLRMQAGDQIVIEGVSDSAGATVCGFMVFNLRFLP